ncbi:hypothetical protein AB0C07_28550 [Actinoplanes missouriensis]|uniref:hypothetical protein n=1 Tax=Actinoplanes missouriensis TaxID=1866 RepID=UPI0033FF2E06
MIDFTAVLTANPPRPSWTDKDALDMAMTLIDGTPFTMDWDADAGEEWISLLDDTARIGMISTSRPVAVLAEDREPLGARAARFAVHSVTVPSFTSQVFVGSDTDLRAAFGSAVDVTPFSANDLWFATI